MCQSVVNVCHGRSNGETCGKSDIDQFCFSVRNMYSAHNQFLAITQTERMVDRTGKPVEEITGIAAEQESSSAQIRTLFNEQRRTIIAECREKVSHHEFQAAPAEQERKILQEELWRQQQDFREVHQQNLTKMEELRKFQSSTFDTLTRQKLIEDQNTIMELSGRLQELQNEVNCMNDSKDFQDAESMGKHAKLKEKQKWSEEKIHLENATKLRGIYFIDTEDTEFKETIKNARKKLETSVAPAMPCKITKNCGSGASNKIQTKLACILEANESTRMRMGNSIPPNHEDHNAGKGENSLQQYNLVHKFIPMPQAMKIPAAKAAVDEEWEKLEKVSAWNLTKVKSKKQVIDEARMSGATVHFASLMDICHLKNAELEAKHQKYKGRVVLRGDIVKDNSGSYAVFTEQGSSASQMTAAKIMDIISRLPGCDGQAADEVSADTQVKMEDAHKLLKIPKSECPDIWIRLPRHKWPKSWSSMEDPVVPLERNLYGHPLAGLLWERQFEKILLKHGWEKIPNWECLFVHREKGLFLSVYVDDIKLAGKKQNLDPMWKVLNKEVDVGEPTSFLDHVYLGCTQRQCEISKDIVDNYRTMFESRISAERVEKLPFPQNLCISSWSYDMAGHAKKCVERYCELANKTTQQLYKVSTPCIDDHHFKEEETKSVGELSNTCSQIVLKCFYLARIGRPDILWSVNKLARSITKWTKACDKRLNRLISYIHHTSEYKQYCHVENTAKQCRLGLFQDSDFAGDLQDAKSTSGGTLCIFGSHTFVPISWMCKKQTAVSHSSTESEIISLDTGLRLDGLPALELWDLIVSVLGNISHISDRTGKPVNGEDKHHKSHNKIDAMKGIDFCSFKCPIRAPRSFIVCV